MKISYNWLQRYIDLSNITPEDLEETLSMMGLEVDCAEVKGVPPLPHVVVGKVLKKEQHPDADRLTVCEVLVGEDETTQIVCGATNFKESDHIPVALPGAVLPGNFKIKKSKLRGVPSAGMMCSGDELGLSQDAKGLYILEDKPKVGTPINEIFTDSDVVFDIELTANRGDCLSHIGVARDIAAWYKLELKTPEAKIEVDCNNKITTIPLLRKVETQTENCSFYNAFTIQGVEIKPSPEWMRKDLEAIGLRPINNIVDITNWVMHETGQPLHAFDASKITDSTIIVRQATEGETITTLDDKKRVLTSAMTVIADTAKPLVIAGVMGSTDAEVDNNTQDIILEAAYFNGPSIRKTARALNLSTDSSHRFIRDVDPQNTIHAARRAIDLILELAGGSLSKEAISLGQPPRGDRTIQITPAYIAQKCGFEIKEEELKSVYERLGFTVTIKKDSWDVLVPSFRPEVDRPIDLVEEFIRIHGTECLNGTPVTFSQLDRRQDDGAASFIKKAQHYLAAQGFSECYNYSLLDEDTTRQWLGERSPEILKLDNPLTSEMTHLRPSLIPGLAKTLRYNQNHGNADTRLFEVGRVFKESKSGKLEEYISIAFILNKEISERSWKSQESPDFYSIKAQVIELLGLSNAKIKHVSCCAITDTGFWQKDQAAQIGSLERGILQAQLGMLDIAHTKQSDLSGPVLAAEICFKSLALKQKQKQPKYTAFTPYPAMTKDLALVMDKSIPADQACKDLQSAAKKQDNETFKVTSVRVFDVFDALPNNQKSIALELTYRSDIRTLKDNEINQAFERTQKSILENSNYSLRA